MNYTYLDNASTTQVTPHIIEKMNEVNNIDFANPSSLHKLGINAEKHIKKSREIISNYLKINKNELIFTGSGTVSNNIAIKGTVSRLKKYGNKIITSVIEHKSVLEIYNYLETIGFDVVYIPVDENGMINLKKLEEEVNEDTILVSIMAVNNEIGTIQPLDKISNIINKYNNIYFHVDGVQAFGKIPINLQKNDIDLFTISSHKIHGPKGIGALYIKKGILIDKILHGSNQENGFYPGTENTAAIAGFGKAVEHLYDSKDIQNIKELKDLLKNKILKEINNSILIGPSDNQVAPHILNIAFANIKGEILIHSLEKDNIYISTGSACSSKEEQISHVIKALNIPKEYREGAVRFSFSKFNTKEEIQKTVYSLKKNVTMIRKITGGKQ